VPGAFEVPLHAKRLAATGLHDAFIACGLVVNGGIYRHELVAATVIGGFMRVQLETSTPILSVVLTPRDFHAHEVHRHFFREHFIRKGAEAAQACTEVLIIPENGSWMPVPALLLGRRARRDDAAGSCLQGGATLHGAPKAVLASAWRCHPKGEAAKTTQEPSPRGVRQDDKRSTAVFRIILARLPVARTGQSLCRRRSA
jgi:hypothetical protein